MAWPFSPSRSNSKDGYEQESADGIFVSRALLVGPGAKPMGSRTIHSHVSCVPPFTSDGRRQPCSARQRRLPGGTVRFSDRRTREVVDRKSTRLNSSHLGI